MVEPEGAKAHASLGEAAVGPAVGHWVGEGDVEVAETRACEERGGFAGGWLGGGGGGLDDDPGQRVRHEEEGMDEAGEV